MQVSVKDTIMPLGYGSAKYNIVSTVISEGSFVSRLGRSILILIVRSTESPDWLVSLF